MLMTILRDCQTVTVNFSWNWVANFFQLNIEVEKIIKILRFLLFTIDMAWQIFAFIRDEVSQAIIEIWIFCYDGVKTAANCSEAARRW